MSNVLLTTGIHHVVAVDGPMPFWVEVRTFNRAPVYGSERRVRGYPMQDPAVKHMRRATKEALKADPSLKRFLTSMDGAPLPPASSTKGRGRPVGSKDSKPRAPKPAGRAAAPKVTHPDIPFSSLRFQVVPQACNPIAQVWRCTQNTVRMGGKRRGQNAVGDLPHLAGSYAVTILKDDKLVVALDDAGRPFIYPDWLSAERDAMHFYAEHDGYAPPRDGIVHWSDGKIEVHFTPGGSPELPYTLLDTRYDEYVQGARRAAMYARLDTAIEEAKRYSEKTADPASARIASLFSISDEEAERIEREWQIEETRRKQADEADARRFAEEEAERLSRPSLSQRLAMEGKRILTREEAQAERRRQAEERRTNLIKNPTPEQRYSATRAKYERSAYDQRGTVEDDDDETQDAE